MIDPTPTSPHALNQHCHIVRDSAGKRLAMIPEDVYEDRQRMLELRDAILTHLHGQTLGVAGLAFLPGQNMEGEAINIDLRRRSEVIAAALQSAFGGLSQLGSADIGRAIAGQISNNGLTVHGTVYEICDAVLSALAGEDDPHFGPTWTDEDYGQLLSEVVGTVCAKIEVRDLPRNRALTAREY